MAMPKLSLYEACTIGDGAEIDVDSLICISRHFADLQALSLARQANLRQWFMIIVGSMIFFMQAGFAMVCAGCVRKKNLQNTMLKVHPLTPFRAYTFYSCDTCRFHQNILDVCLASFVFYMFGYGIAFGGDSLDDGPSFVGKTQYLGMNGEDFDFGFWFMQFALCATCT